MDCETMWFIALDGSGKHVPIKEAMKGVNYYCPFCGEIMRCRGSDGTKVRKHFYHLNQSNNQDKGESSLHKYWKEHLINIGEVLELPVIGQVKCLSKWIEYPTSDRKYRPDLIIKTDHQKYKFIIIEIYNSKKKDIRKYGYIWEKYRYPVFEINVKELKEDKSNLLECIRVLYTEERQSFFREKRQQIRELRKILVSYKNKLDWEKYYLLLCSSNKIFELLSDELYEPARISFEVIERDLRNTYMGNYLYCNFAVPLISIIKEIKIYV